MSSKWREGMVSRARVQEYAKMLLGPYRCSNDVISDATKTLYKLLNEQMECSRKANVKRWERKVERLTGAKIEDDVQPRRQITELAKARAGYGPDWKVRLAQAFFGKQMEDK